MRTRVFLLFMACCAQVAVARAQTLAFPEAEGFGRFATGARTNLGAATVYHVTNLNDSGPGSFRDAVSQSNRFVVFDVGGIANINSVVTVASNITIAGQTAPGGFTLYNNRIAFHGANNLVSRHFAVRKGTASGREDTASIARGQNMIFDHMSITWGVDSNFDINPESGQVIDNITIQNSIIGQGLDNVGHSTGQLLQPGEGGSTSIIKSLYIDNVTRNPKVRFENEFINNVVYGYLEHGYIMGDTTNADSFANVEGNYFIKGSSTFHCGDSASCAAARFHIYPNDNWVDNDNDGALDGTLVTSYSGATVVPTRHAFPTTASMTAQEAVDYVRANAGPSIIRNVVDARMMTEVGSYGLVGGVIQRESDLFPNFGTSPNYLTPRARFTDTDNDGMADNWELSRGLNPANSTDWKGLSGGYTRLEEYVNELGATGNVVNSNGGTWSTPATWSGSTPTLADSVVITGNLNVTSGHAFARRLSVNGSLAITGGTLDVFDTLTATESASLEGGVVTAGRVLLGSSGGSAQLEIEAGGTLQSGTLAIGAGTASFAMNGGTFRATGVPDIRVATVIGSAGGTFDTNGYSGTFTGAISGSGRFTKSGAGDLELSGNNTFTGPTVVNGGTLSATKSAAINSSSAIELSEGTTFDVSSIAGGYVTGNGQTISGAGQITGSLVTTSGSVLRPQGGEFVTTGHMIGIQAESMSLGSDWAVFDNASHGTGNGGSYNGADLDGGGIVQVATESLSSPASTGLASKVIDVPVPGPWYLFAKVATPATSGVTGDPSTHPGGNNSFHVSNNAGNLQATTSNFNIVQTPDNVGDDARWIIVSPSLSPLSGVAGSLPDAGINYNLTAGMQTFTIGAREIGTVLDGFVLSTTNLTAAQLDSALAGTTVLGYSTGTAISGSYAQQAGSVLAMQLASGAQNTLLVGATATLGGNLSVELMEGFVPQPSDMFTILDAGNLVDTFAGLPDGARVNTTGVAGSFVVNYDYANDRVTLSGFMAGIAGDFDEDGDVDGRDFLLWQRNPSIGNLADWQTNYAANALNAANISIPEPGTLLMTSLYLLTYLARR